MKPILFLSSAKEMKQGRDPIENSLCSMSNKILQELQNLSLNQLQDLYHSSLTIAKENQQRFRDFSHQLGGDALEIYHGVVFKNMCLDRLSEEEVTYLKNHTVILSALYGPIFGCTKIRPYRLDFNMGLQVDGKTLKQIWKPYCTDVLSQYQIFNLASQEFSSCLDRAKLKVVDIEFYVDISTLQKPPSATVKKLRGQLIYSLAKIKNLSINVFDEVHLSGYHLYEKGERRIIYVKAES